MLVRDRFSGVVHEVPELSKYDLGEVVYDGPIEGAVRLVES